MERGLGVSGRHLSRVLAGSRSCLVKGMVSKLEGGRLMIKNQGSEVKTAVSGK